MPAEVYVSTKPASAARAWLVALLILTVATTLAGVFVQRSSGSWRAGDLIQPNAWEMAFRPPAQFHEVDPEPDQFSSTYAYRWAQRDGRTLHLMYWRMPAGEASAAVIARRFLERYRAWIHRILGPAPTQTVGRLGRLDALEVLDPAIPLVLRTIVGDSGWAYGVSLRVEGGPIDQKIYTLFEMICQSVRFRKPGM